MDPKRKFQMREDPFYNLALAASLNECTGLTPSAVTDNQQAEAYAALYGIHLMQPTEVKDD